MTRSGIYILFVLMIVLSSIVDVYSADISRDNLETVERQARMKEMELKKKQAESIALSLELSKLNEQMLQAAQQIQNDENKTTEMENKLDGLKKDYNDLAKRFAKEHENLSQMLLSMQSLALYPSETLVVQPLSPVEIIQSAILMRESVPYVKKNADKLKKDIKELEEQKVKIEKTIETLKNQKQKLSSQQEKIKKLVEQKKSIRKQIDDESSELKVHAEKLALEAADLRELVEKLEKDEELKRRRRREIDRAVKKREQEELRKLQEEQKRRISEGKSKGFFTENGQLYSEQKTQELENLKPQYNQYAMDFAMAKGRLSRPVTGQIITSYGNELSKGVTSKGIVIKTRAQAQVIAPYDGSVIFSGPFKGYGNLIIIDHSNGYISLLAGLEISDAQTGQMVLAGEPLGIMPDSDTAKLYMEIRKDQNPINPEPWLEK